MTAQNLINLGHGVFVSEARLEKMKKDALKMEVQKLVRDSLHDFGLDQAVRDMVRRSIDNIAEVAQKDVDASVRQQISNETPSHIAALINEAVKDAVLKNLAEAGLDREANALVWQAIMNMRKAAMA